MTTLLLKVFSILNKQGITIDIQLKTEWQPYRRREIIALLYENFNPSLQQLVLVIADSCSRRYSFDAEI